MSSDKNELFWRYKETGDTSIRNEIVLRYMESVRLSAMSLRNMYAKGYDVEDLVNEGVIALISAVETFDYNRGVKFETFASIKIKGAIIDYIRRQDWIPRHVRRFGRELNNAYGELYHELGRNPTNRELAAHMGMTKERFAKRLEDTVNANTLSFEELLFEDNFTNKRDDGVCEPGSGLFAKEQKQIIANAIAELKPKEQQVVSLYYYENLKLKEIADVLGVTESRVSQIHSKSMLLLKRKLEMYIKE